MRLVISPVEYRHLRACGRARIAAAVVLTGLCVVTLCFGGNDRKTYGWAIWFGGGAAANAAFGSWELNIAQQTNRDCGARP
jgi:hypothetical protein